jgi:hypothetical protein
VPDSSDVVLEGAVCLGKHPGGHPVQGPGEGDGNQQVRLRALRGDDHGPDSLVQPRRPARGPCVMDSSIRSTRSLNVRFPPRTLRIQMFPPCRRSPVRSVIPESHTVRLLLSVRTAYTVEGRAWTRIFASKCCTRQH